MLRPGDVRPGDPSTRLTADEYNRAVAAVRGALGLSVAPPLTLRGRTLGIERRDPFWATLSGSGSPYSFVEAADTPTVGTWAAMPRAGTTNAFEANGVSGLGGKRVLLRPGAAGDYRFQWVADGGTVDPPDGSCGCFAEEEIPTTLYWTYVARRYDYFAGGIVTLGTTSGTLTYTDEITYGGCSLGIPGWVGEFEYWTEGIPPDTGISALKIEHCSTLRTGGVSGPLLCNWLAIPCTGYLEFIDGDSPMALWLTRNDSGPEYCIIGSPCAGMLDGAGTPGIVNLDGTFTAGCQAFLGYLCEHGAAEVDYTVGIAGGVSIAHSALTISL